MKKISIIGAGAMGGAVARGLVEAGMPSASITVSNPTPARLQPLAELGIKTLSDNRRAVRDADLVVIAVKPWILPTVAAEIRGYIDLSTQEVAVIVAGVSCEELREMFRAPECQAPTHTPPLPVLSIVMPNTAMTLRQSMTFIVEAEGHASMARDIFSNLGKVMTIEERLLAAATALASCGIAYAMRYVRASVEGGVELGFRADDAQAIVVETIKGAAALLSRPGTHPETEIDKVTTPGGLTIRGLNAMEAAGFTPAVISALRACR